MPKRLEELFPVVAQHRAGQAPHNFADFPEARGTTGRTALEEIPTKWRVILTLQLQGMTQTDIAARIGMSVPGVGLIVRDDRYVAYRDEYLAALDGEFFSMKPLALTALRNGLTSGDEDTALKAADQWFRGAQFGGYSKKDAPATSLTAEDVVRQLLQVNVQVNVGSGQDD